MPSTPKEFKPSDLIERIGATLNATWSPTFDHDGYVYSVDLAPYGRDNWSVNGFVTVTSPDGATHRLRLEVHDLHQSH